MLKKPLFLLFGIVLATPVQAEIANEPSQELQACVEPSNLPSHFAVIKEMVVEKELNGFHLIRLQFDGYRTWTIVSLPCKHHVFVGGDGFHPDFRGLFKGKGPGVEVEEPFTEFAINSDNNYYRQQYPHLERGGKPNM